MEDKSFVVIDTPKCCLRCPLFKPFAFGVKGGICSIKHESYVKDELGKPDYCPLIKVPEKMVVEDRWYSEDYARGYDACIDELMKKGKEKGNGEG